MGPDMTRVTREFLPLQKKSSSNDRDVMSGISFPRSAGIFPHGGILKVMHHPWSPLKTVHLRH